MTPRVLGSAALFVVAMTVCGFAQGGEVQFGSNGEVGQRQKNTPARPTPRSPDGRVNLGPFPGEVGMWLPFNGVTDRVANPDEVPFQPWAKALYDYRRGNQFEPHTRCKPSGGPRQFLTPYGVEFVDLPELQRIFIMDLGGPHIYRTIFMDGRRHPKDLVPSYYGYSVGRWEGDTLVVDSRGFNEGFWFDRGGLPHTDQLHMVERFTRTDSKTMKYEVTIDDPGAYTATWSGGFILGWDPEQELFEYICQDNNFASSLMVGAQEFVDRHSTIVP